MVVDHILGEVDLDARAVTELPWQQACISFAQNMFDALSRHGNVASLLIDYTPMGPNALANRELCLSVLLDNGFAPAAAAHAYATLARYVLGFAIQLSGLDGGQRPTRRRSIGCVPSTRSLPLSRYGRGCRRAPRSIGGGVHVWIAAHRRRARALHRIPRRLRCSIMESTAASSGAVSRRTWLSSSPPWMPARNASAMRLTSVPSGSSPRATIATNPS